MWRRLSCIPAMGRVLALFMAISMTPGVHQATVQLLFMANRDYVASELCVERDEPISVCGGSCFLEKQLERTNSQDEERLPVSEEESKLVLSYAQLECFSLRAFAFESMRAVFPPFARPASADMCDPLFRPPIG